LDIESSCAENTVNVKSLQNKMFLNLWLTNNEIKFIQAIEHLFGE